MYTYSILFFQGELRPASDEATSMLSYLSTQKLMLEGLTQLRTTLNLLGMI